MPYCPKCRNYVERGRRVCGKCGAKIPESAAAKYARKRQRTNKLIIAVWALLIILIILCAAFWLTKEKFPVGDPTLSQTGATEITQPSTTPQTQPTQTQPTQTTPSTPSTENTDPTVPSLPTQLYTRAELEAMENNSKGYGCGRTSDGIRTPYAVSDQNKYSQYGANFIGPDDGNIYLTFDCGYEYTAKDANGNSYRVTERILDILKEKNAKAVFFVTMYYVEEQPDLVQRMIDEGHIVGNHSNNHPVMPSLTIDEMEYEVMSLHEYVLDHFGYEMFLFRPPTGAYSTRSLAVVQNLGYKTVHWSFAYVDYDTAKQPNVAESLDLVTRSHHSGAIYLLHAISTTNASLLSDAIDFFRAEGYTIALFS